MCVLTDLDEFLDGNHVAANVKNMGAIRSGAGAANEDASNVFHITEASQPSKGDVVVASQNGGLDGLCGSGCKAKLSSNSKACVRAKTNASDLVVLEVDTRTSFVALLEDAIDCLGLVVEIIWQGNVCGIVVGARPKNGGG